MGGRMEESSALWVGSVGFPGGRMDDCCVVGLGYVLDSWTNGFFFGGHGGLWVGTIWGGEIR